MNYPNARKFKTSKRVKSTSKYHAKKVELDGHKFDSKAEARYYSQLKQQGVDFKCHERFELIPTIKLAGKTNPKRSYTPDFSIYEDGKLVRVIDVKGMRPTADASLRFALFRSKYAVPVYIARYDRKTGLFEETLA